MTESLRRAYAEEVILSRPVDFQKTVVVGLSVLVIAMALAFDVLDRHDNLYYLRSMLATIIGLSLIASMYNYVRHFVDEARAGPDYVFVRRRGVSAMIPLDHIKRVRHNVFISSSNYFGSSTPSRGFCERFELHLSRPCGLGDVVAFCPQSDWRSQWSGGAVTQGLVNRLVD